MATHILTTTLGLLLSGLVVAEVPDLQLGIGNGYYDAATETLVTSSRHFVLNAYADRDTGADERFSVAISVLYELGLDPENFGSFHFNGRNISAADMVFGKPPPSNDPAVTDHRGIERFGLPQVWYFLADFHFDNVSTTSPVNTRVRPQHMPVATIFDGRDNYLHFQSFGVSTLNLKDGYNLHFALYAASDAPAATPGVVSRFAPLSHDAATAYVVPRVSVPLMTALPPASIPEPEILLLVVLALGGIAFSQRTRIQQKVARRLSIRRDSRP